MSKTKATARVVLSAEQTPRILLNVSLYLLHARLASCTSLSNLESTGLSPRGELVDEGHSQSFSVSRHGGWMRKQSAQVDKFSPHARSVRPASASEIGLKRRLPFNLWLRYGAPERDILPLYMKPSVKNNQFSPRSTRTLYGQDGTQFMYKGGLNLCPLPLVVGLTSGVPKRNLHTRG